MKLHFKSQVVAIFFCIKEMPTSLFSKQFVFKNLQEPSVSVNNAYNIIASGMLL